MGNSKRKFRTRILLKKVLIVSVPFLFLFFVAWILLNTSLSRKFISQKISAKIGFPVEIDSLAVGWSHTKVSRLRIMDPEGIQTKPLLEIPEIDTDVAIRSLFQFSFTPSEVILDEIALQMDAHRLQEFQKRFPKSDSTASNTSQIPRVKVNNLKLHIDHGNRPPFLMDHFQLSLDPMEANNFKLETELQDSNWGKWKGQGLYSVDSKKATIHFDSQGIQKLHPDLLLHIPFIPEKIRDFIQLAGGIGIHLRATWDGKEEDFDYIADIDPRQIEAFIPSLGTRIQKVDGQIHICDKRIELNDIQAHFAGGVISIDGMCSFLSGQPDLQLEVKVEGIEAKLLPKEWGIDQEIDGKMFGKAHLRVRGLSDGGYQPSGYGYASIKNGTLAGVPVPELKLKLSATDHGFTFQSNPKENTASVFNLLPIHYLQFLSFLLDPKTADKLGARYIGLNIHLQEFDINRLADHLKVQLPIKVAGKVNINTHIDIPSNEPDNWSLYRLNGTIQLPDFNVAGFKMQNLSGEILLDNGIFQLNKVVGEIPGRQGQPIGKMTIAAQADLNRPQLPFTGRIELSNFSLRTLDHIDPSLAPALDLHGDLLMVAKLKGDLKPVQWEVDGEAHLKNLILEGIPLNDWAWDWKIDTKRFQMANLRSDLWGGKVSGTVDYPLERTRSGTINIQLQKLHLNELAKQVPVLEKAGIRGMLEGEIIGSIEAANPLGGNGQTVSVKFGLNTTDLNVENVPIKKVAGEARYENGALQYRFFGEALGGKWEASGRFPENAEDNKEDPIKEKEKKNRNLKGMFRLEGIQFRDWNRAFARIDALSSLNGKLSLFLEYQLGLGGPIAAVGTVSLERLLWQEKEFLNQLSARIDLQSGIAKIDDINASLISGKMRGIIYWPLLNPEGRRIELRLENIKTLPLVHILFPNNQKFDTVVSGVIRGSLGREFRLQGLLDCFGGKILNVPVTSLRLPMRITYNQRAKLGEIHVYDILGQIARGRMSGSMNLKYFSDLPLMLELELLLSQANIHHLLNTNKALVADDRVSGKLKLAARGIQSINQLTGSLELKIADGHAMKLPIFGDVFPLLSRGIAINSAIQSGSMKASLIEGIWRVSELKIQGTMFSIFADGIVTMDQRLDLRVIATVGNLVLNSRFQNAVKILTYADPSVVSGEIIRDLTRILQQRSVQLRVTGTILQPRVEVKILESIPANAFPILFQRAR